ncbi:MAG: hypothetical protein AB1641_24785 [Thermodesulfobacteriota bacterium]
MPKTLALIFACWLILGSPAWAAEPQAAIDQASASLTKGDYTATIGNLREALEAVWNLAPLSVRNATFVVEPPGGYGVYTPRAGDSFPSLEPLLLYCEPVGYTLKKTGDEYSSALTAGFAILDEKGTLLGGQPNFGLYENKSRNFGTEYMMYLTFNLKGLPAGNYKLQVTLKDKNSTKTVTFEKPFSIK